MDEIQIAVLKLKNIRESLQVEQFQLEKELYDFIFSKFKELGATDVEQLKEKLIK